MIRKLSILFLLFVSPELSGQQEEPAPELSGQQEEPAKPRILKQWNLSSDFTEEVTIPFDTVFSLFHHYRLAERYSTLNATLGNYGLPFYQINFFDRVTDPDKFLYTNYYPFMYLPERAIFMNNQVPFTELVWTYGAPRETSEQTFRVRHSQNVNRFLNFGLIYDITYNLGQYNYQRADNKAFTLFSSYTSPKYKLYFSAGVNNLSAYENGGIMDKDHLDLYDTREVPVNLGALNKAISILRNRNILLVQRYTIGGQKPEQPDSVKIEAAGSSGLSGTFSHILTWENNRRSYSDNYATSGFYDTAYINTSVTFDSLYSRSLKNTIRFDFTTDESEKFRLGAGVGLRNELFRYSQIIPVHDTIYADTAAWRHNNNVLTGKLYNDIGEKFNWSADGELFLTGYRAGDFFLKGKISKLFHWGKGVAAWMIRGSIMNRQASFWYEQWGSNHFEWQTDLKKEFRMDMGSIFSYPARNTEIGFNYTIIDNYTDFNTMALPSQHGEGLSVAALSASKEIKMWKFHFASDVLLQKSSNNEILDLPFFSTRTTFFFEHLFRFKQTNGKLNVQLGADVTYHTLYHPYSYMPSTGRFYRQDQLSTGNYPFIDVFLNVKLQRTRMFIMFDHLNSGFMGTDYFMIPSYPMNIRMIRYGFAWTFYN